MDFMESAKTCLQKYIDFNGRASRSEYWWFVLLTIALSFIPVIGWILRLVLLLPSLAVQVRRLHDMNRSAWWLLLLLPVPPIIIIGAPVLLIMSAFPGTPGPNRYGPNPLQPQSGMGGYGYYQDPGYPYPPSSSTGSYTESPYDLGPSEPDPVGRRFCTQCGMQLQPEARFCTDCGAAV